MALPFDRRVGKTGPQPLGHLASLLKAGFGQQDGKLLAADARHHIHRAHTRAQPARHLPQRLVAGIVAVGIIDLLEPVNIQGDHREGRLVTAAAFELQPGQLEELAAVEQLGQGVGNGHVDSLLIQPGVFQGNGGLVSKGLGQLGISLRISLRLVGESHQETHALAARPQRQGNAAGKARQISQAVLKKPILAAREALRLVVRQCKQGAI